MKAYLSILSTFVVNLVIGLMYSVILSRSLGVEVRGEFYEYQLISLIIVSVIFTSFSQPCYEMSQGERTGGVDLTPLLNSAFISSILSLFFSFFICYFSPKFEFISLYLLIFSQGLTLITLEFLKYTVDFRNYKKLLIIQSVFPLAFVGSFFLASGSILSSQIILLVAFSYLAFFLFLLFFCYKDSKFMFNYTVLFAGKTFFFRVWGIFLFKALGSFVNYLDKILLMSFAASYTLGLVAVCISLETVSSRLYQFLANVRVNSITEGNDFNTTGLYSLSAFIGVIGIIVSYYFGDWILQLLFGSEFSEAHEFLVILISISVCNGLSWVISQEWLLSKSLRYVYYRQVLGIVALIVFLLVIYVTEGVTAYSLFIAALLSSLLRLLFTIVVNFYCYEWKNIKWK